MRQYGRRRPIRAGSVGLVVRDLEVRETDPHDLVVLTAGHTFPAGVGAAVKIAAPSALTPSPDDGSYFGTVRRLVPADPMSPCAVDAAIIKPESGLRWDYDNSIDGRPPVSWRDLDHPAPNDVVAVAKHGAASGLTSGQLDPITVDHHVYDTPSHYTGGWFAYGNDRQFAGQGDSGAIVVDEEHNVIGMAVAIEAPQLDDAPNVGCFIHGIRRICIALGVELLQ